MSILVIVADVVSTVAFAVALVLALRISLPKDSAYMRAIRLFLALAMGTYLFVGISNVLEHAGITAALDTYEDYVEILFVPLIAYILYTLNIGTQMEETQAAKRQLHHEHDLLNGIVETSPAGIMLVGRDGRIEFANDRAIEFLELSRTDDGQLALPADLDCTRGNDGGRSGLRDFVDGTVVESHVCNVYFGRRRKTLSVSAQPLRSEDGTERGSVLAFADITAQEDARRALAEAQFTYQNKLEETVDERTGELLEANRRLEFANMAKGQFLANVSHELRTPLNSVIGFTDLMLAGLPGPLNEEQEKQLGMVKDSAFELLCLVNDILDLERIETGNTVVKPEDLELSSFLEHEVEMMRPLAVQQGLRLTWTYDDCGIVNTDAGLLGQVVRNLLSNAIKFTESGGSVSLSAECAEGRVRLVVRDSGIGIPGEYHSRVFEAFAQIDSDDRAKPPGTGLGLTICRDICALLGGEITLDSQTGEGATFTVDLPRVSPTTGV